ncbi:M48 family metallopeptidase [Pontibacter sp. G13]|uniref:M48 family metallopeptidase n=1 Tax=Pontibacter sp. G13 TaxID=3074898 RepID=UPI00288B4524|nr:M48 family metallopeptidase [Pontibacter sp. G13]WNJ20909.1 M48 family metallopeptidase [Pontibacter sp. G13]
MLQDPQQIKILLIGLLIGSTAFDILLSWLNLRSHTLELPNRVKADMDATSYARSKPYHEKNFRFGLLRKLTTTVLMVLLLATGAFGELDAWLRTWIESPIWLALAFFGVLSFGGDLLGIPFQYYQTFKIEAEYGFNKMTPKTFWLDKIKGWVLGAVLGGLIVGLLIWLVDLMGPDFWWIFWAVVSVFMLLVNVFYTSWLLPIFNKLTPLENGELREKIESYCQSVDFPLENLFVMDGSKRSSKANAFFSGMGKRKKVVLYDTLIEKHPDSELVAILAHEVGHYKRKHIVSGMVLGILQTGLMLFILSKFAFSETLSAALGGEFGIHLNLLAFGMLYSPISTAIAIGMNLFSRKNEYEADEYAATTYEAEPLATALIKLHGDNLANLTPHPLHVFLHYSHPPLLQRLGALDQVEASRKAEDS